MIKGLFYSSYLFRGILWLSGLGLYNLIILISFMGYILTWGQLSFWGGTVISNIFNTTNLRFFICGSYSCMSGYTNIRFFVLHLLVPILLIFISLWHICILHLNGSNNISGNIHIIGISLYPIILIKDILGLYSLIVYIVMIILLLLIRVWHPDNILHINDILTPIHIVPEWYLLHSYMCLKVIPWKTCGILILINTIGDIIHRGIKEFKVSTVQRLINSYNCRKYGNINLCHYIGYIIILGVLGAWLPEIILILVGRCILIYITYSHY
jgi:quinol-cytochrome oxidoreductase complex cytochrome b subunit